MRIDHVRLRLVPDARAAVPAPRRRDAEFFLAPAEAGVLGNRGWSGLSGMPTRPCRAEHAADPIWNREGNHEANGDG